MRKDKIIIIAIRHIQVAFLFKNICLNFNSAGQISAYHSSGLLSTFIIDGKIVSNDINILKLLNEMWEIKRLGNC